MGREILRMENISKSFPGVKALDDVRFNAYEGEVMALLGENGAGKSTLMKILSGVYTKDTGKILLNGKELEVLNPKDAFDKGIAIIHQELNLVPNLTVYENIFLGREETTTYKTLKKDYMIKEAKKLLDRLKVDIDPTLKINEISLAKQQMVEIAKALSLNTSVIIMDEPTDTLTDKEVDILFDVIRELKAEKKAIVYISHRLKEVFEICDRVTVLRDGKFIDERLVSEIDEEEIIKLMVGRTLDEQFPYLKTNTSEFVFEVKNLTNKYVKNISFSLKRGEVLGISGLVGAGRSELGKTIFGLYPIDEGEMILEGKKVEFKSPKEAIENGIMYVSEDRKSEGLVLTMDVKSNITLSSLDKFKRALGLDKKKEERISEDYRKKINIKTPTLTQKVKNLSGGNQQKVAIAKSLLTQPKVLILDEPTRGIDVGAKREIYDLLNVIKKEGHSVIMISSEMPEILGMSDRIIVMHEGKIKGELTKEEATSEKIMNYIIKEEEDRIESKIS
ncbi:sugar ABC transporter ATP-binding protein [Soehngenia longivitae]|uniref:Sugar ABC transporter ATP-binding protein n=1 Tax=Soehngenia longivitae TaxID=2562294 RepID=A0A4Z0D885_9FIRM|nr:sugar ABC transporter ATP-binding protein [Soehngenia longivitae]TFZ41096.1 sugar ABC transporter ATP-binding protein [Soehngenia longivitae]